MNLIAAPAYLSTASGTFDADFKARLHISEAANAQIAQQVQAIVADVRTRGDAAVLDYTARWDGVQATRMGDLELTQTELKAAFDGLPKAPPCKPPPSAFAATTKHKKKLAAKAGATATKTAACWARK